LGASTDCPGWAARPQAAQCQLGGSAFPVPALTAEQVLGDGLNIHAGEQRNPKLIRSITSFPYIVNSL
jgi:hypothetical protein